jgi:hypothetical protein
MSKNAREASPKQPERPASDESPEVASTSRPAGFTRRSFIARLSATGVASASTIPLLRDISAGAGRDLIRSRDCTAARNSLAYGHRWWPHDQ